MNPTKFRTTLNRLTDEQADAIDNVDIATVDVNNTADMLTALRAVAPILRNLCGLAQIFTGTKGDALLDKVIALLDKIDTTR
jgi:hypothetical protein